MQTIIGVCYCLVGACSNPMYWTDLSELCMDFIYEISWFIRSSIGQLDHHAIIVKPISNIKQWKKLIDLSLLFCTVPKNLQVSESGAVAKETLEPYYSWIIIFKFRKIHASISVSSAQGLEDQQQN
jgi:hypothetical protein